MTTLRNRHELLATVPFLIGYHPSDSIVFIALREKSAGVAMRIDYPRDLMPEQFQIIAEHLIDQHADEVVVVLYHPDRGEPAPKLIETIQDQLAIAKVPIAEMISVIDERWRSIFCTDVSCCPPDGTPLANSLTLELMRNISLIPEIDYLDDAYRLAQQQGALAINDLIAEFRKKGSQTSIQTVALALARLQDLQVRDYALGVASDEIQGELMSIWAWLTSIAPRGYVAAPATLFAQLAYEQGQTTIALRGIERALDDQPAYELARLLRRTFAARWPVESFKSMRAELHPKICASLFGGDSKE